MSSWAHRIEERHAEPELHRNQPAHYLEPEPSQPYFMENSPPVTKTGLPAHEPEHDSHQQQSHYLEAEPSHPFSHPTGKSGLPAHVETKLGHEEEKRIQAEHLLDAGVEEEPVLKQTTKQKPKDSRFGLPTEFPTKVPEIPIKAKFNPMNPLDAVGINTRMKQGSEIDLKLIKKFEVEPQPAQQLNDIFFMRGTLVHTKKRVEKVYFAIDGDELRWSRWTGKLYKFNLKSVQKILVGKQTDNFLKEESDAANIEHTFSLITSDTSLDLEAPSKEDRDSIVILLRKFIGLELNSPDDKAGGLLGFVPMPSVSWVPGMGVSEPVPPAAPAAPIRNERTEKYKNLRPEESRREAQHVDVDMQDDDLLRRMAGGNREHPKR